MKRSRSLRAIRSRKNVCIPLYIHTNAWMCDSLPTFKLSPPLSYTQIAILFYCHHLSLILKMPLYFNFLLTVLLHIVKNQDQERKLCPSFCSPTSKANKLYGLLWRFNDDFLNQNVLLMCEQTYLFGMTTIVRLWGNGTFSPYPAKWGRP